ncbi:MAG: hypothetical protein GXP09_12975 [Gammaproteobacteria bacterium]|nr:hypothetical protein [Gammaproteobacteria bacterium]
MGIKKIVSRMFNRDRKKIAFFAGDFCPALPSHVEIAERGLDIVDTVLFCPRFVSENKDISFGPRRVEMLRGLIEGSSLSHRMKIGEASLFSGLLSNRFLTIVSILQRAGREIFILTPQSELTPDYPRIHRNLPHIVVPDMGTKNGVEKVLWGEFHVTGPVYEIASLNPPNSRVHQAIPTTS